MFLSTDINNELEQPNMRNYFSTIVLGSLISFNVFAQTTPAGSTDTSVTAPSATDSAKTANKTSTKKKKSTANASTEAPTEEEAEVLPHVEVEKYDAVQADGLIKGKSYNKFDVFTNFHFNNLTAKELITSNTFNLNTSTETVIGMEYARTLSDATQAFVKLSYNQFSVAGTTAVTPNVDANGQSRVAAAMGLKYLFTDNNFLRFAMMYRPHYYMSLNTLGRLDLDYAPSTSFSASTENQFYNGRDYTIGAQYGVEYIANSKISGSSLAFDLGIMYLQEFKNNDRLAVKLNYSQTALDTDTYNLVNNSIAMSFSYTLPN